MEHVPRSRAHAVASELGGLVEGEGGDTGFGEIGTGVCDAEHGDAWAVCHRRLDEAVQGLAGTDAVIKREDGVAYRLEGAAGDEDRFVDGAHDALKV